MHESLLDSIIHEAKLKGSSVTGWTYSTNNRIILHYTNQLPKYFVNIAWAIDTLIHQYNLRSKYKHLYGKVVQPPAIELSPVSKNPFDSSIDKTIKRCDLLLLDSNDLTVSMQHKIYDIIYNIYRGKKFNYDIFTILRTSLMNHYLKQYELANTNGEKNHLRSIVHFFEEVRYGDLSKLID